MKILHLIQKPQLRGAEMFASQLSTHLQEAGHDVLLVSLLAGNAQLSFSGKHVSLERPLGKRFIDVQGWRLLAQYIQEFKPDVIQANAGDTLKYAVFSKLIFGWKAPIIFRNANKVSDFINTTPKLLFNRFLISRLHHVISVSELCRQDFIDTYSYNPTTVTTIPIGIELQHSEQSLSADVTSIFQQGKVLLHVASFVPEKNHAGLLRIMKILLAADKTLQVILVGDGKLRVEIEKQIQTNQLSGNVHVLGYRHDVLALMQHASACVLPSLIEGLPGVILEAMYCKTPVIAYDVGGISEVVKNHETGWLVKKNDEEGFVKALHDVLQGSDVERIKENAYAMVVKEYDNRGIARRFEEVYKLLTPDN